METQRTGQKHLPTGGLICLTGRHDGATVRCLGGTLWVTRQGDGTDYMLRPGDSLTTEDGRTVIQAMSEADLMLTCTH